MVEFGGQEEEKDEEDQEEEEKAIEGDPQVPLDVKAKKPQLRQRMSSVKGKPVKENLAQGTGKQEVRAYHPPLLTSSALHVSILALTNQILSYLSIWFLNQGRLIVNEVREIGSIKSSVYTSYSKAGYGFILLPTIAALCIAAQAAQVLGSYWIVWWQSDQWNESVGFYMALYAVLGVLQAIMTLLLGVA